MTLEKLKKMLADGVITEEEYEELLEKFGLEEKPELENPMEKLDDATKAYIQKLIQSEKDKEANRVGNAKKTEIEDWKNKYEQLAKEKLSEEEKNNLNLENKKRELENKEREFNRTQCKYTAAQELRKAKLDNSDEIVALVIGANEEETREKVAAFSALIEKLVKAKVEERFKEGGRAIEKGANGGSEANPWKPGQINLTEQFRIESEDPQKAKMLMQAAGV